MPLELRNPPIGTTTDIVDQELYDRDTINGTRLICQVRKSSNLLYRIFVELIRQAYSNAEGRPLGPPPLTWHREVEKTQIWIDTQLAWSGQVVEFRPAIYVSIGNIEYKSQTGRADGLLGSSMKEAETFYSRSGSAQVTFTHVGATSQVACDLGDTTLDYIDVFSPVIRDDFCFTRFNVVGRVPVVPSKKESKERYASSVIVDFEFEDTWALKLESQKLKSVIFRVAQRALHSGITVSE